LAASYRKNVWWCTDPDLEPVGVGGEVKLPEVMEEEAVVEDEEEEDKFYWEV